MVLKEGGGAGGRVDKEQGRVVHVCECMYTCVLSCARNSLVSIRMLGYGYEKVFRMILYFLNFPQSYVTCKTISSHK